MRWNVTIGQGICHAGLLLKLVSSGVGRAQENLATALNLGSVEYNRGRQ